MAIEAPTIDAIRQASGGFSFFSGDGCHLVEHTMNDIRIAMQLTVPEGIVFVDDYTNSDWPGVHEGVARPYITARPPLARATRGVNCRRPAPTSPIRPAGGW
jgi:hypothetical protein